MVYDITLQPHEQLLQYVNMSDICSSCHLIIGQATVFSMVNGMKVDATANKNSPSKLPVPMLDKISKLGLSLDDDGYGVNLDR